MNFQKKNSWRIKKNSDPLEVEFFIITQFYNDGTIAVYLNENSLAKWFVHFFGDWKKTDYNPRGDIVNAILFSGQFTQDDLKIFNNLKSWKFYTPLGGKWTFGKSMTNTYSLWIDSKPNFFYLCPTSSTRIKHKVNGISIDGGYSLNCSNFFRKGENYIDNNWDSFLVDSGARIIKSNIQQPFVFVIDTSSFISLWKPKR